MSMDLINETMEDWNSRISAAEEMMPIIGRLFREKSIETSIFGRLLNNRTVINVIKCCRFARQVEDEELTAEEAREVLLEVAKLDLNPCHVDIGKLAVNYRRLGDTRDLADYVSDELKGATGGGQQRRVKKQILSFMVLDGLADCSPASSLQNRDRKRPSACALSSSVTMATVIS